MFDDDLRLEYLAQTAPKRARRQRRRQTARAREDSLLYVHRALESDKLSPKKRDRLKAKLATLEQRASGKKQRHSRVTASTDSFYKQRGTQLQQQRSQEQALKIIYQVLPGKKENIEQLAPRTFLHDNVVYRVKLSGDNISVSAKTVPLQLEKELRYEYRIAVINGRRDKYSARGTVSDLSTLAQELKTIQDRCTRSMPRITHAPNPKREQDLIGLYLSGGVSMRTGRNTSRVEIDRLCDAHRKRTPLPKQERTTIYARGHSGSRRKDTRIQLAARRNERRKAARLAERTSSLESRQSYTENNGTLYQITRAAYGERPASVMEFATTTVLRNYKPAAAIAALLTVASFVGYQAVTRSSANDQLSLLTGTDVSLRLVERGEQEDTYLVLPYSETLEDVQRDIEFERATGIPTGVLYENPEGYKVAEVTMQKQGGNYTSGKIKVAEGKASQVANASVSLDRILNLPGQSSILNNKLADAQQVHNVRQQYGHGHR
jgi:hypothetical protein